MLPFQRFISYATSGTITAITVLSAASGPKTCFRAKENHWDRACNREVGKRFAGVGGGGEVGAFEPPYPLRGGGGLVRERGSRDRSFIKWQCEHQPWLRS